MRSTSIAAYHAIEANGLLNIKQWSVYRALYNKGPLTGAELDLMLNTTDAHKRVSELVDRKVVAEVGSKVNEQSGMRNILFDVTDHIPPAKRGHVAPRKKRPTLEMRMRAVGDIRKLYLCASMVVPDHVAATLEWAETK